MRGFLLVSKAMRRIFFRYLQPPEVYRKLLKLVFVFIQHFCLRERLRVLMLFDVRFCLFVALFLLYTSTRARQSYDNGDPDWFHESKVTVFSSLKSYRSVILDRRDKSTSTSKTRLWWSVFCFSGFLFYCWEFFVSLPLWDKHWDSYLESGKPKVNRRKGNFYWPRL